MSMKRFGKAAYRIANEVLARNTIIRLWWPRIFPISHNLGAHVVLRNAGNAGRQTTFRLTKLIARNGRIFRPFSSILIEKNRLANNKNLLKHRKFHPVFAKRPAKYADFLARIRKLFGENARYNEDLRAAEMPRRIDEYEFGEFLGQGCNAAVYEAKLAGENGNSRGIGGGFNEVTEILRKNSRRPSSDMEFRMNKYPLAIKLMFNYDHDKSGENHLWETMGNELAAYPKALQLIKNGHFGTSTNFQPLPKKHPNIVRITTAFIDTLKILPDAVERYPDALHTARWYEAITATPKTMYIVMRRYRQTLHDYVWTHHRNYWTGRVMMAQLMEACTYLHENCVAQRDMKSDNILLHYDYEDEIPQLVIADFGCALATGSWLVDYPHEDIYLGGNRRTRAPEILAARPGPRQQVDFELADTWAAGGLSYEILTRTNPFYKQFDAETYNEQELPILPKRVHFVARQVVEDLLKREKKQRIRPNIAANALNLSLFRMGEDVKSMLEKCGISKLSTILAPSRKEGKIGAKMEEGLDKVIGLITAETIVGNLAPHLITRAERQLRATFLSRLNRDDIWKSLQYFFPTENTVNNHLDSMDSGSIATLVSSFATSSAESQENLKIEPKKIFKPQVIRTDSTGILQRIRSK
ncbi:unnamed protein product [Caenorhabditis angaria]|uniref:non-specific serine/threonine protein kinase n=1 Tax=Caenorhabditis angaria TaxID=860376 RepID=A0A9P1IA62_9PELO|nr:unnamed protein product [Caenorhabditis angaria]